MPLVYDNYPPTADDVRYDPRFIDGVNGEHGDAPVDDVVMFNVGTEDAYTFASDLLQDETGMVDLAEVRRGLSKAASVMIESARVSYEKGVEHFIVHSLARARE